MDSLADRVRALAIALEAEGDGFINGRVHRDVAQRLRGLLSEEESLGLPWDTSLGVPEEVGLIVETNDRVRLPEGSMPNMDVRIIQFIDIEGEVRLAKFIQADNVPISQIGGALNQVATSVYMENILAAGSEDDDDRG